MHKNMRSIILLFLLLTGHLTYADTSIPSVYVETENQADIVSKEDYINATVKVIEGDNVSEVLNCEIKGRGNYTWKAYPKKPYKVKFKEKQSPFGFPPNKKWVLLADYCDCSLLRSPYMSELSKAIGLEWTFNYQHVNLYINNEYVGIYIFIDQLEKSKNRIVVEDDGFIIENDIYYYQEPLFFTSNTYSFNYSFKYPTTDGEKAIQEGDESWIYIVDLVNRVESAILNNDEDLPNIIDYDSFAKWYILMELSLNVEPNIYYVLNKRGDLLKMYPAWDAEWSLGLTYKTIWEGFDWLPFNTKVPIDAQFWPYNRYFKDLIKDKRFRNKVVEVWDEVKPSVNLVNNKILQVRNTLESSIEANFEKWQILGTKLSVSVQAFPTWELYCNEVSTFLNDRIEWFDSYIHSDEFVDATTIDAIYEGRSNHIYIYNLNGTLANPNSKNRVVITNGKKIKL